MNLLVPISEEYQKLFKNFNCGISSMNEFLSGQALYYDSISEGKSFLLLDKENNQIISYFTLKCSSIQIFDEEMMEEPKVFSAVEISRLAVNQSYQKQGYGEKTLAHALEIVMTVKSNFCGVRFVTLFAIPDAVNFYKHTFNFEEIEDGIEIYCNSENKDCIFMYSSV